MEKRKHRLYPVRMAGEVLTNLLRPERKEKSTSHLHEEIRSLSFGRKDAVREYYVRKLAVLAFLSLFLVIAVIFLAVRYSRPSEPVPGQILKRGSYGEAAYEEELLAVVEGESEKEEVLLPVTVHSRSYTAGEAKEILEQAVEELDGSMLGENESRDHVTAGLYFPGRLREGIVAVEYLTVPWGLIQNDGSLSGTPDEEGSLVEIKATLTCQDETMIYETAVRVFPPELGRREELKRSLELSLASADEDGHTGEDMQLPSRVEGRRVSWLKPGASILPYAVMLLLILPAASLIWDRRIHEKAAARKVEMMIDYPGLLWKMAMLLGAGLTIRNTFFRIGSSYSREAAVSGRRRYAYEEVLYTCREMKSGVPEGRAYENFGRRCDLECFVKLGSLLSQNLKKGSAGLVELLDKEAAGASRDRTASARKLGEQAGTRMLFPMILLLGVVLVVLIAPAFMAM